VSSERIAAAVVSHDEHFRRMVAKAGVVLPRPGEPPLSMAYVDGRLDTAKFDKHERLLMKRMLVRRGMLAERTARL
jgi:hypothetical protein